MNEESIIKIRKIIADKFNLEIDEVTMDKNLEFDFGADSLDLYEILVDIENTFDMKFSDEEYENVKSINDIVKVIENKKQI